MWPSKNCGHKERVKKILCELESNGIDGDEGYWIRLWRILCCLANCWVNREGTACCGGAHYCCSWCCSLQWEHSWARRDLFIHCPASWPALCLVNVEQRCLFRLLTSSNLGCSSRRHWQAKEGCPQPQQWSAFNEMRWSACFQPSWGLCRKSNSYRSVKEGNIYSCWSQSQVLQFPVPLNSQRSTKWISG